MSGARLGALALLVPDYDAAIFFFVSVMGFRLTADIDQGRKRWVTVEPPGGLGGIWDFMEHGQMRGS